MDSRRDTVNRASPLTSLALAGGPLLSVWWVSSQAGAWGAANAEIAAWVVLAFWTPFAPFTFAAIWLGDHRDRARLSAVGPVGRGVLLVPWLVCSPFSTARLATVSNLVAVAAAAAWLGG